MHYGEGASIPAVERCGSFAHLAGLVIASEAKQSNSPQESRDCLGARAPWRGDGATPALRAFLAIVFFEQFPCSLDAGGNVLEHRFRTDTLRMQEHPQGLSKDDLVFENSALNFIHHLHRQQASRSRTERLTLLARFRRYFKSDVQACFMLRYRRRYRRPVGAGR